MKPHESLGPHQSGFGLWQLKGPWLGLIFSFHQTGFLSYLFLPHLHHAKPAKPCHLRQLKKEELLVEFSRSMGEAVFVSHQWTGRLGSPFYLFSVFFFDN